MDETAIPPQPQSAIPTVQQQVPLPKQSTNLVSAETSDSESKHRDFTEKPGGIWYRGWASFIDGMVISIPFNIASTVLIVLPLLGLTTMAARIVKIQDWIGVIIYFIIYFAYHIYLTVNKGATFGKDAYGMKVVAIDTQNNISYKNAIIRELVKVGPVLIPFVGILYYFINGLVILFSSNKRGVHDRLAKSQVLVVKKPWSLKKQFAVFGLLLFVGLLPLAFLLTRFYKDASLMNSQEDCIYECIENSTIYGVGNEIDDINKYCVLECQK